MRLAPIVLAMLIIPAIARAGQGYSIVVASQAWNSTNPLQRDTSWAGVGAGDSWIAHACARTTPGTVETSVAAEQTWFAGSYDGTNNGTIAFAGTDDFVISGPSGNVTGTMYFHVVGGISSVGGLPDSDSQQGYLEVTLGAAGVALGGTSYKGNHDSGSYGCLLGQLAGGFDTVVGLTQSWPVGQAFAVSLKLQTQSLTYGDPSCQTAYVSAGGGGGGLFARPGGIAIGNASGQVMDLPAGFTVNSVSWGVVSNQFNGGLAAVAAGVPPTALALSMAGANPARGDVRFHIVLPQAGRAELGLFDAGGRRVRTLAKGEWPAGGGSATWDGCDTGGAACAPGVYFARLLWNGEARVTRVVLLRE